MNTISIDYYSLMLELTQENQKINESIFGSKVMNILNESRSSDELAIYEANIISSIIEFMKKIFDKVIEFFTNIINRIFKKEIGIKVDNKLIKACEEKIKSISNEDRINFKLEKANADKPCYTRITDANAIMKDYSERLKPAMDSVNDTIKTGYGFIFNTFNAEEIKNNNEVLDNSLDKEKIKEECEDIKFSDISGIISDYKNAEAETDKLRKEFENINKDMKRNKRKIEKIRPASSENKDIINNIKNSLISVTNIIAKSAKTALNLTVIKYRSKESILRKFVSFNE